MKILCLKCREWKPKSKFASLTRNKCQICVDEYKMKQFKKIADHRLEIIDNKERMMHSIFCLPWPLKEHSFARGAML